MMGDEIVDTERVEGNLEMLPGLGLLPVRTKMSNYKTTRQVKFRFMEDERICDGYEIHMGRTVSLHPFITFEDGTPEGCIADGRCFGSYVHGLLDNAAVIEFILNPFLREQKKEEFDPASYRQSQYDLLADWLRKYVDIPVIYEILKKND